MMADRQEHRRPNMNRHLRVLTHQTVSAWNEISGNICFIGCKWYKFIKENQLYYPNLSVCSLQVCTRIYTITLNVVLKKCLTSELVY